MSNDITFSNYTNTAQLCDSPNFYTDRSQYTQSNDSYGHDNAAAADNNNINGNEQTAASFSVFLADMNENINSLTINHVHYYYLASTHWKWMFIFSIETYQHI